MNTGYADLLSQMTQKTLQHWQQLGQLPNTSTNANARVDAQKLVALQLQCLGKQQQLWNAMTQAMQDQSPIPELVQSGTDARFADSDWTEQPLFNFLRQSYLLNVELMEQQLSALQFDEPGTAKQIQFFSRQWMNALAPSNFAWTNPEIMRDTLAQDGKNLRQGMANFLDDLSQSPALALRISQVSRDEFAVGRNVANAEGQVVYRNTVMELIQYAPTTEQVFTRPLLVVPPFINKFYILDLNAKKSLVRWLVDQGYTLFMISWINPGAEHKEIGFADYLRDGVAQAIDLVRNITGSEQVNAAGYCVGGTLLATTQAWLTARGEQGATSLTLLTTLLDFSEPGDLGHYMSRPLLDALSSEVAQKGFFDGRVMATSFNFLRENNLYWPNFINNYLKGKKPPSFDLLYWNGDSTHLSAAIVEDYVKGMYLDNRLLQPRGLVIDGTAISLSDVDCPAYCVGAQSDHIVLWGAAYKSARCLRGPTQFILAGSGHIAGVVNPPSQSKYGYQCIAGDAASLGLPTETADWLQRAQSHGGSWWQHWHQWLAPQSGARVAARNPGSAAFPALCAAPGTYVHQRI
jgi:polyhydroxyalkanoate synthase subunit PhaC